MSFSENCNGFTPSFVSLALSGLTHRFILVLECESRLSADGSPPALHHPRFCVGGPRATLDPRNVSITELMPLSASKVDLPPGWEKVHQLIYGKFLNYINLVRHFGSFLDYSPCVHGLVTYVSINNF
jgi:hypothetical protein